MKSRIMKTTFNKIIVILTFLVIFPFANSSFSQLTTRNIFTSDEMVWYGLDFSEARFIGLFDQISGYDPVSSFELVNKYIPAWNELVLDEPWNFDLKCTFRKKSVFYDICPVESLNRIVKIDSVSKLSTYSLPKDRLDRMIMSYPEGLKKEGLRLVFIVESFNKTVSRASYWMVFFDIKTKKILLSEYCHAAPKGFGVRNYWAGSLKHVLNDIQWYKYEQWKKTLMKEGA